MVRLAVAVAATVAAALVAFGASSPAASSRDRPRGFVEDCSSIRGVMARREFGLERNLVVGPLAILHSGKTLPYVGTGNKLFVLVRGGHRITLELSRETRRGAGLGFGRPEGEVRLRDTRRVVRFVACHRGEWPEGSIPDGWPVSGWVGFLIARSPRCVPLRIWVDDEPRPRRAVIRFGVSSCD